MNSNSNNKSNNNNNNKERRRRLTFPVRRQLSYDRTLFNREMFYKAYNPAPTEATSTSTLTSTLTSVPIIECPYSDEPYTYTGLSSPNLRPRKITTTDVSADGLLKPPSRNDQNRRRNSSPIGRDVGKEITENFLFSDDLLSEISRVPNWWEEEK